ncbi:MAG: cytochrome c oxidase subunit 3 family protein [Blastocatellia bacterium]
MSESQAVLADHLHEQFDDPVQQKQAGLFGMWVFLSTEILFFGALFASYTIYRSMYPYEFEVASHTLNVGLGTTNTLVLIVSSLTVVMAVRSAQAGKKNWIAFFLVLTIILGFAFLGIKAIEYYAKFQEHHVPGNGFSTAGELAGLDIHRVQIYFVLYFAMTGLHAFHMIIGIGIMTWLLVMALRGTYTPKYYTPVEISGLYWHFVDIIWIFLYPLFYLVGAHLRN